MELETNSSNLILKYPALKVHTNSVIRNHMLSKKTTKMAVNISMNLSSCILTLNVTKYNTVLMKLYIRVKITSNNVTMDCNNVTMDCIVSKINPKKQTNGKTTRKKKFFNKELQLISTNKNGIF